MEYVFIFTVASLIMSFKFKFQVVKIVSSGLYGLYVCLVAQFIHKTKYGKGNLGKIN